MSSPLFMRGLRRVSTRRIYGRPQKYSTNCDKDSQPVKLRGACGRIAGASEVVEPVLRPALPHARMVSGADRTMGGNARRPSAPSEGASTTGGVNQHAMPQAVGHRLSRGCLHR